MYLYIFNIKIQIAIKRLRKILKRLLIVILLLLFVLYALLAFPPFQSYLAQHATKWLSKKYHTSIVVDKIDLTNFENGLYLLYVHNNKGELIETKKVILNK